MSSGSFKDIVKALDEAFSRPSVDDTLTEELQRTIDSFLAKHQKTEESQSSHLQDELLNTYHKHVSAKPEKYATFLNALTQLRPILTGQVRFEKWWALLVKPILDGIGHKRKTIDGAKEFLLSILVYDSDDDESGDNARLSVHFTNKLLSLYLKRTRVVHAEGYANRAEDDFVAEQLQSVLLAFGQKKSKDFLVAADSLFVTVEHRLQALTLLCALLRFQPPHLYTVAQTPLIEHLLQCLMNDTSATAIELALMVLTMFLPHIPSSLTSHLPRLYLIYSRILCWERFGPTSSREDTATDLAEDYASGTGNNISPPNIDPDWPTLHHSFEEAESKTPELLHFFTFMYGLYPLNFMSYIRKPRKYLQNISFPGANDFDLDQSIIRKRTEQFQEQHILHPNFFNTTIEDELTDNRWIRSDPAEVVSVCVGLYIPLPIKLGDPGPPPTGKLPDIPEKYMRTEDIPSQELGATDNNESMSGSDHAVSRRQSGVRDAQSSALPSSRASIAPGEGLNPPTPSVQNQQQHGLRLSRATSASSRPRESSIFDSPTLPALSVGATDQGQLAKDASMTGIRSDRNGSVASLSSVGAVSPQLSVYPRASELNQQLYSPANTAGSQNQGMMAYLQEEVILLRSNLDFKRWQTQQHLAHIGQRQRKHINEAAVEAEMQDLRSTIRSLRAKLAKGGEAYTMLKKESAASRNHTKKWDAELTAKLEEVRESEKRWKSTEEQLRQDLRKAQKDCDHLRRLIEQSEARETLSHQKIETMKLDLEDLEKLRAHVQDLEEKVRDHQIQEMDFEQAKEEEEILRTELATASLRLQSSHAERERIKKAMDRKLADMESQLQASSRASSQIGSVPPDVQARLDDALAGSHAKVAQMKKAYERLNARFVALKLRYEELEGEHADDAEDTLSTLPSPRSYSRDLAFVPAEPLPFPTPPTGSFASDPPMRPLLASSDPAVYGEHIARNGNGLRSFSSAYSTIPAVRPSSSYPGHAPRHDSLPRRGTTSYLVPSAEHPTALRSASSSMASASEPAMLVSSSRSTRSVETATSEKYKGKIEPKSEVRVFGRGGAQNIKMKEKEKKEKDKEKGKQRIGGLFGNRGIL